MAQDYGKTMLRADDLTSEIFGDKAVDALSRAKDEKFGGKFKRHIESTQAAIKKNKVVSGAVFKGRLPEE